MMMVANEDSKVRTKETRIENKKIQKIKNEL